MWRNQWMILRAQPGRSVALGASALFFAAMLGKLYPDLRRYLRMKRM